ncbi:lipocalin family protein [Persicitalea sp.]|uniref:lipocalin family protein n=1 Tax=Persicitalea sp. TaxID=3100273 RepID=UPI00359486E0
MHSVRKKIHPGFAYGGFLAGCLCLFLVLMTNASSPDRLILGTWKEVTWEYEKVDNYQDEVALQRRVIDYGMRQLIAKDLIIHEAEQWRFLPNGTLQLLTRPGSERAVQWSLKGRGHILTMQYDQLLEESYTIAKLTENELVLYFHTDIEVRGIAKITFRKIR